jgi:hypothetical protein
MSEDKPRPVGRPSLIETNPEIVKKLEEAAELDCTIGEMCFNADISTVTYYEYIKHHPEFANRIERLRNKPIKSARKSVIESFKEKPDIAFKYLERKAHKEFAEKKKLELSGDDDSPVIIKWQSKEK